MRGESGSSPGAAAAIAILGGVTMLAGLRFTWVTVGFGGPETSGIDHASCWVPVTLSGVTVTGCAVAWRFVGGATLGVCVAFAAGFGFIFAALTLVVVECSSELLPAGLLPATVSRSVGITVAGSGLWMVVGGSAVALAAATGVTALGVDLGAWMRRASGRQACAALGLLLLMGLLAWLRYQPWIDSAVAGHDLGLSGQAAPWVGPASLFALLPLAVAVALAATSRFEAAGLVAAATGWLVTFLAAMAVIAANTIAGLRLEEIAGAAGAGDDTITVHTALAVWGTYVLGALIAAVGAFLVFSSYRSGGG